MIVYLTSSPTGDYDGKYLCNGIDNRNHFLDNLLNDYQGDDILMITADPYNVERNTEMKSFFENAFRISGFEFEHFDLWDGYNDFSNTLHQYGMIVLGGGHVPTQHEFFQKIGLKTLLNHYDGIVVGISAGTMNCAKTIYVQPEHEGESDPSFTRFIDGLGLSDIQVLPHYQVTKHFYLDNQRLFEDITYKDSYGHQFICINDGSYIKVVNHQHYLYGEAYRIQDGKIELINENNQIIQL